MEIAALPLCQMKIDRGSQYHVPNGTLRSANT